MFFTFLRRQGSFAFNIGSRNHEIKQKVEIKPLQFLIRLRKIATELILQTKTKITQKHYINHKPSAVCKQCYEFSTQTNRGAKNPTKPRWKRRRRKKKTSRCNEEWYNFFWCRKRQLFEQTGKLRKRKIKVDRATLLESEHKNGQTIQSQMRNVNGIRSLIFFEYTYSIWIFFSATR